MEGKAVNRVHDHRNSGKLCGQAADETCFRIVGVYYMIRLGHEVSRQVYYRLEILQRVERLHQAGKGLDFHPVALNKVDQCSSGRAGQDRFISVSLHASHSQKGINPRTAYDGQRVYVEDPDHRLVALTSFPGRDPGDRTAFSIGEYSIIEDGRLEYFVFPHPGAHEPNQVPNMLPTVLSKEKGGLGFSFVYYDLSGN